MLCSIIWKWLWDNQIRIPSVVIDSEETQDQSKHILKTKKYLHTYIWKLQYHLRATIKHETESPKQQLHETINAFKWSNDHAILA